MNVLLIYPNMNSEHRIPLGLSLISAVLKKHGHEVMVYDTTFTTSLYNEDTKLREIQGTVKKSDIDEYIGDIKPVDHNVELGKILSDFRPELVCMNSLEHNFYSGVELLKIVKGHGSFPTLVGGVYPTICPDIVIANEYVDMICVGEGEEAILDVVDSINQNKSLQSIGNIWTKQNGKVVKAPQRILVDLDKLPYQDWDSFDLRHLYKAFNGKVWRAGGMELSRGCVKSCSFCVEDFKKRQTNTEGSKWRRMKSPEVIVNEMAYFKKAYDLNMMVFGDENFLIISSKKLQEFADLYIEKVNLPFIMQTGVETVTDEKVRILKDMKCVTVSLGVESGDEPTRRLVLNKKTSDKAIFKAFDALKKYGIRSTANYIIGLPYDTEKNIRRSMEFNLELMPDSIGLFYFVPFMGTELYEVCVRENIIERGAQVGTSVHRGPMIDVHTISRESLMNLFDEFIDRYNEKLGSASPVAS